MNASRAIGLTAGLIAGIVCASVYPLVPFWLVFLMLATGCGSTFVGFRAERRGHPWHAVIVLAAAMTIGFAPGYLRMKAVTGEPAPDSLWGWIQTVEEGTRIQLQGVVSREPERRADTQLDLQIRVTAIRSGTEDDTPWVHVKSGEARIRVFVYPGNTMETHAHFDQLCRPQAYGYRLELTANYRPISELLNPADFDMESFLRQSGAELSLRTHAARVSILETSRGNPLMELALAAKADFLETIKQTIRSPASRLTAAATLGARRAVEKTAYRGHDIAGMFRHAGVGHVLAVSGLHVSVIAVMLFALFRLTGLSPRAFVPPLIFLLILFALLTGARPSSVRAVIMNSAILTAIAYFRCDLRSATVIGLSLSALLILLVSPMVLYSPGFLLSYGAVLSLIVLVPGVDRFLRSLRGASLFGFLLWFAGLLWMASSQMHLLCRPLNVTGWLGALWLTLLVGTALNHRFPRLWIVGLERVPMVLRLFLAAQLSIQIGMMIPLSAWFFGQFPVAGVLVNLAAIPSIAVVVQLGMMIGLIGLLPLIGPWLALPLGAAATVIGHAFILLAYGGMLLFPFPVVPKPSLMWMVSYYGGLALLILLERQRVFILETVWNGIRRIRIHSRMAVTLTSRSIPAFLVLLPFLDLMSGSPTLRQVDVLAAGRYPILIMSGGGQAVVMNAGGGYDGERLLFNSIRLRGATQIDALLLPSPDPRAGLEGAAALLHKMTVRRILMPVHPAPDQSLTAAIGDAYLVEQAAAGTSWAVRYDRSYETFREAVTRHKVPVEVMGESVTLPWSDASLVMMPRLEDAPPRFAASALSPVWRLSVQGLNWVIVTDTTPEAFSAAIAEAVACDILVVPNLGTYATYSTWMRKALEMLQPRVMIIGGDSPLDEAKLRSVIRGFDAIEVFQTGLDGSVGATFRSDGTVEMKTHRSGRLIRIPQ